MLSCAHMNTDPHNPNALPYHQFPRIINEAHSALRHAPKDEYFREYSEEQVKHWKHTFNSIKHHLSHTLHKDSNFYI